MKKITSDWKLYEVYCWEYEQYTMNILALNEDNAIAIFKQSLAEDFGLDMDADIHFRVTNLCCDVYRMEA